MCKNHNNKRHQSTDSHRHERERPVGKRERIERIEHNMEDEHSEKSVEDVSVCAHGVHGWHHVVSSVARSEEAEQERLHHGQQRG